MRWYHVLTLLISNLIPFPCNAEEPPTSLEEVLTAIDTIAPPPPPSLKRRPPPCVACMERVFELCRTAQDPRALAFEVFNRSPNYTGSDAKLGVEVCLAFTEGLARYTTPESIEYAAKDGKLTWLHNDSVLFPKELTGRQFLVPYAAEYVTKLKQDFAGEQHGTFRLSSLVRSTLVQQLLARYGKTPASCKNTPICSTHTTGAAFDISFRMLTKANRDWLSKRLAEDMRYGKVLFITEERGGHFHVFVPKPNE